MAHKSPDFVELARRIVEHEAGGSPDPAASAAAVERACARLKDDLVALLGSRGVFALLGRALHLAQREQPLLEEVVVSDGPEEACFTGLAESLAATADGEARDVAADVLAHVLDLLVVLLGHELGMKPVRKRWPQATRETEIDE